MAGVLDCIIIIKAVLGGWTTDRTRIIHIADELTDGPLAGWVAAWLRREITYFHGTSARLVSS